jgi:hypothetical protein
MEVGEDNEREGEGEPAVEIAAVAAEAQAKPDGGRQAQERQRGIGERRAGGAAAVDVHERQQRGRRVADRPRRRDQNCGARTRHDHRPPPVAEPRRDERRERDQGCRCEVGRERAPRLGGGWQVALDERNEIEDDRPGRDDGEARGEEEVKRATFDLKADDPEDGDDRRDDRNRRVGSEPRRRIGLHVKPADEQHPGRADGQHRRQDELVDQPGTVRVSARAAHIPSCRQPRVCR